MLGSLSLFSLLHLSGRKHSGSGKFCDILPINATGMNTWVYVNNTGGSNMMTMMISSASYSCKISQIINIHLFPVALSLL